jgi:uncharacterized membrane protein YcaP (DUF421 family)
MIRTLILYIALVASMRVMGKRQLGQLEPAELVIAVLISDLAAHPLQDIGTPLLYGLIPVITLLCCEVLISAGIIKSLKLRTFVCGKPSIIIDNGRIVQAEMKKNRFTLDELTEDLRKKSILDIATVKYAILETDGSLSTLMFPAEAPVTPKQMNINADDNGYPIIVINDGRVLEKNLNKIGYNMKWLTAQLKNRKISEAKDVYLMSVDSAGKIYFAIKEPSK